MKKQETMKGHLVDAMKDRIKETYEFYRTAPATPQGKLGVMVIHTYKK